MLSHQLNTKLYLRKVSAYSFPNLAFAHVCVGMKF